jgi:hypothetical protein
LLFGVAAIAVIVKVALTGAAASDHEPVGTMDVRSVPEGARVTVDLRDVGQTPVQISIGAGSHTVAIGDERYLPAEEQVTFVPNQVSAVSLELWRRSPSVTPLRPSLPGATITSADFLADGTIVLGELVPSGQDQQIRLLDWHGATTQLGPSDSPGPLALAPDGKTIAAVVASDPQSTGQAGPEEILVSGSTGDSPARRYRLADPGAGQPTDLTWAPDQRQIVVTVREQGQVVRTRILRLDLERGNVSELITLPANVVHDSFAWSPNARDVAFLTRTASLLSLCVLDTTRPDAIAYLADVGRADANPLSFPPIAWSADGQHLVYAAPVTSPSNPTGWLFGAKPVTALYQASLTQPIGKRVTGIDGMAPVWRADGTIMVVVPGHAGALDLRERAADGATRAVGTIPVNVPGSFAIRWDVRHERAIVVSHAGSSVDPAGWQFWLFDFRSEAGQ